MLWTSISFPKNCFNCVFTRTLEHFWICLVSAKAKWDTRWQELIFLYIKFSSQHCIHAAFYYEINMVYLRPSTYKYGPTLKSFLTNFDVFGHYTQWIYCIYTTLLFLLTFFIFKCTVLSTIYPKMTWLTWNQGKDTWLLQMMCVCRKISPSSSKPKVLMNDAILSGTLWPRNHAWG